MKTIIALLILLITPPWILAVIFLLWFMLKYDAWKATRPWHRTWLKLCFSTGRLYARFS